MRILKDCVIDPSCKWLITVVVMCLLLLWAHTLCFLPRDSLPWVLITVVVACLLLLWAHTLCFLASRLTTVSLDQNPMQPTIITNFIPTYYSVPACTVQRCHFVGRVWTDLISTIVYIIIVSISYVFYVVTHVCVYGGENMWACLKSIHTTYIHCKDLGATATRTFL